VLRDDCQPFGRAAEGWRSTLPTRVKGSWKRSAREPGSGVRPVAGCASCGGLAFWPSLVSRLHSDFLAWVKDNSTRFRQLPSAKLLVVLAIEPKSVSYKPLRYELPDKPFAKVSIGGLLSKLPSPLPPRPSLQGYLVSLG
jgi:hypothetical protein